MKKIGIDEIENCTLTLVTHDGQKSIVNIDRMHVDLSKNRNLPHNSFVATHMISGVTKGEVFLITDFVNHTISPYLLDEDNKQLKSVHDDEVLCSAILVVLDLAITPFVEAEATIKAT